MAALAPAAAQSFLAALPPHSERSLCSSATEVPFRCTAVTATCSLRTGPSVYGSSVAAPSAGRRTKTGFGGNVLSWSGFEHEARLASCPSRQVVSRSGGGTAQDADLSEHETGEWEEGSEEEDWEEEELDALFEKFGETVREDSEALRVAQEQKDDEESKQFAVAMARAAADGKGADIVALHVKSLVYWARCFVLITAFSRPQVEAIRKRVQDAGEELFQRLPSGGDRDGPNSWTLLDYGDVVIHIFMPAARSYYNLEEFYGNATPLELPFEQEERR